MSAAGGRLLGARRRVESPGWRTRQAVACRPARPSSRTAKRTSGRR